jgi:hypothetical protein
MILAGLLFLFTPPAASVAPPANVTLTSVGRDLTVTENVGGRVVSVFANVKVDARVEGDVIAWGGDVVFGPAGSVGGNLSVFGGKVESWKGGPLRVDGTISTPGTLLNVYLAEMYHAPWEARPRAAVFRGLRLIGLSVWLAGTLLLLYFFGSPVSRAALCAEEHWTGALLAGALTVLSLLLAAAAALALLPSGLSIPIALFVAGLAVGAKVFGMGALFLLLGQKLLKNVSPARRPAALAAGFAVLGGVSLVPLAGPLVWSAASVVAVGVAMLSRFGTPRLSVSAR